MHIKNNLNCDRMVTTETPTETPTEAHTGHTFPPFVEAHPFPPLLKPPPFPTLLAKLFHKSKEYDFPDRFAELEACNLVAGDYTQGTNRFRCYRASKYVPFEDNTACLVEAAYFRFYINYINGYKLDNFENYILEIDGRYFGTLAELIQQLEVLWLISNAPSRKFLSLLRLSTIDLTDCFCIPAETVRGWTTGGGDIPLYIRLLVAKAVGLVH